MLALSWKRLTQTLGLVVVFSLLVFTVAPTQAKMVNIDGKTFDVAMPGEFIPGEVIVQARPEAVGPPAGKGAAGRNFAAVGQAIATQVGGRVEATIPQFNLYRVKLSALPGAMAADVAAQKAQVQAALQSLKQNPTVMRADFNYKKSIIPPKKITRKKPAAARSSAAVTDATPAVTPESDLAPQAVTPKFLGKGQWHLDRIKFWQAGDPPATAPTIAVVDTGVDYEHPDLSTPFGKVILGKDFYNNDDDPWDDNGHGTHVAGIAAASGDGPLGLMGVSPTSRILAVKVFSYSGSADSFTCWQGWLYAADYPGVKVINFSGSGYAPEDSFFYDMEKDVVDSIVAKKVVFVCAAANDANLGMYPDEGFENTRVTPAWFPNSLTVAASDVLDYRTYFSNYNLGTYGSMTFNYDFVKLVAPGWSILSSVSYRPLYDWYNGTSMASPVVAGAAARLLAKTSTLTPAQVRNTLQSKGKQLLSLQGWWYSATKRVDLMRALGVTGNTGFQGVVFGGQNGRFLSGVKVEVLKHGTTTVVGSPVYTTTDGFFTVLGLTAGSKYDFRFTKSGKYSQFIYTNYGAGVAAVADQIIDLPHAVALNRVVPAGEWSLLIVWNSWQPGYSDAVYSWPTKPAWYPFDWFDARGTYFTSRLKLPDGAVLHPNYQGNRLNYPFAQMTQDPWFENYDTGIINATPCANFIIIQPVAGANPYTLYTHLNNITDSYWQWGTYEDSKAVAYLYKGGTLKATIPVSAATNIGTTNDWWNIATIDNTLGAATVVNQRQDTEP